MSKYLLINNKYLLKCEKYFLKTHKRLKMNEKAGNSHSSAKMGLQKQCLSF